MRKSGNVCRKFKMSLLKSMMIISFCIMMVYPLTSVNHGAESAVNEDLKAGSFSFVGAQYHKQEKEPEVIYEVTVNGKVVGYTKDASQGEDAYLSARMQLSTESSEPVFVDAVFELKEADGKIEATSGEELKNNIYAALNESVVHPKKSAYALRIGDVTIYLSDKEDVYALFERIKNKYDKDDEFEVVIGEQPGSMFNAMTASIVIPDTENKEVVKVFGNGFEIYEEIEQEEEPSFEDGLKSIDFEESIEIVESFVSESQILSVEDAVEFLTKENEEKQLYTVVKGDSMWKIAREHGMSLSQLFALNEGITEKTLIQIGQKIVITIPEPELSVLTEEVITYEENYNVPVQYIYNDSWYTTKSVVRQNGTEGHHVVTASVSSRNGKEYDREIIEEVVTDESTPKIVEVGTIAPPTYIVPVVGAKITSKYGMRWGRLHAGVDYGIATGSSVMASCGGKVIQAGWNGGYGYCVLIQHSDGSRTRYAHLSKILVSVGQTVKQGQKIALSGNTGNSTGPHLHFEIIINGSAKDPLKYVK